MSRVCCDVDIIKLTASAQSINREVYRPSYPNSNFKYFFGCIVLGKGLELLSANGGRFQINQLLFADDTALVVDSEDKLFRLVSEFGRVCERRKLRVNVGKSKVMRCFRYGNRD